MAVHSRVHGLAGHVPAIGAIPLMELEELETAAIALGGPDLVDRSMPQDAEQPALCSPAAAVVAVRRAPHLQIGLLDAVLGTGAVTQQREGMSRGPPSGGLHQMGECFGAAFPDRVQKVGERARVGPDGEGRSGVEVVDVGSRVDEVVARPISSELTGDPYRGPQRIGLPARNPPTGEVIGGDTIDGGNRPGTPLVPCGASRPAVSCQVLWRDSLGLGGLA